jgi:hypothetical protein
MEESGNQSSRLVVLLCPECEFEEVGEPAGGAAVTSHLIPGIFFIILSLRSVTLGNFQQSGFIEKTLYTKGLQPPLICALFEKPRNRSTSENIFSSLT